MREIKFRIWHEKVKIMSNAITIWELQLPGREVDEDGFFMQYTGLKDKEGTEICEGDIIYLEYWNDHLSSDSGIPTHETRIVLYKEGSFNLVALDSEASCAISFMNPEFAKIVGNICQDAK